LFNESLYRRASRPHSFHEEKEQAAPFRVEKKEQDEFIQAAGNKRSTGCTELHRQHLEIRFDIGRSPRVFALHRTRKNYMAIRIAGISKLQKT